MTIIRVNLHDGSSVGGRNNIATFNNVTGAATTGLRVADCLDIAGAPTGVTLTQNGSFTGDLGSSTIATTSPDPDFPVEFFYAYFYAGSAEIASANFTHGGLPVGASYTLKISGASGNSDRDTNFSATNGTPNPALYDNIAADPPTAPVSITGTVPAGGDVTISTAIVSTYSYVNGWQLEYVESGPTITDVDTDESVYPGQSFVITGTNFGATQGTGGVTIGSVAQTVTSWGDTSITCTAVRGGNSYGTGKTLTVTTDAATTATITVAQEAEPGTFAVTAASPNTTDDASLWTGLIDTATSNPITIVDGDQAWVKNPNNLTNLAIAPDGTITADEEGDFVVQIWLLSEGVWGSDQTVTFAVPDDVAPVFSVAPAVAATNTTGHTISATIDEGGTLYGVRLADGSTAPSSAQVKAGQDAAGAAALEARSAAATASTSADLVFSTASSGTAYDYYVVAEDDASTPNVQASPTLIEATTSIEPPPASVPGSGRRGFLRPAVRGTVNSIIGSIIS